MAELDKLFNQFVYDGHQDMILAKVADDIERVGWSVIGVMPTDQDPPDLPPFMYTIGLTELGHSEMIITSMSTKQMHESLHAVYAAIKNGDIFTPGERTDKICGPPYTFGIISVPGDGRPAYVARRYYGRDIPLLQAVWPDEENRLPWQEGWNMKQLVLDQAGVDSLERDV